MDRGRVGTELRASVALLSSERWFFAGLVFSYLGYGLWVLTTGIAFRAVFPGLAGVVIATVSGVGVTAFAGIALILWFVLPGLVTVFLLNHRLRNSHGNLVDAYRLDHPGVLLAVPGLVLLACLAATSLVGPSPTITWLAVLASVHLVLRTVAYGYRVYTFSYPTLFSLLVFVTTLTLAAGWLAHLSELDPFVSPLADWSSRAGVTDVVQTGLALSGMDQTQVLSAVVAVPGLLVAVYLVPQVIAGTVVRLRAPLPNPQRRPDQRFPIMPPVSADDGENSGPAEPTPADADERERGQSSSGDETAESTADSEQAEPTDHSGTRVFSPTEPVPDEPPTATGDSNTTVASGPDQTVENNTVDAGETPADGDEPTDDEPTTASSHSGAAPGRDTDDDWLDDTAVFSPEDREDPARNNCSSCGKAVSPSDSSCPNCGATLE